MVQGIMNTVDKAVVDKQWRPIADIFYIARWLLMTVADYNNLGMAHAPLAKSVVRHCMRNRD